MPCIEEIIVSQTEPGHFTIRQGERWADNLVFDEMLALFVSLSLPEKRAGLQWMMNKDQHNAREDYYKSLSDGTFEGKKELEGNNHGY